MHDSQRQETCWRVVEGSSGRLVFCAIYESTDAGVELRIGYASDRILHTERLADVAAARARAEHWLCALRAAGNSGSIRAS